LLLRLSGVFLLRFADRKFAALLFQLPPRFTRFDPDLVITPNSMNFQKTFFLQSACQRARYAPPYSSHVLPVHLHQSSLLGKLIPAF
jgi:hypothetical protein